MILLLGATGLLGRNVLELLLERKIPVRALVRRSLDVPGAEIRQGSILSEKDLQEAAAGCSAIINCAGTTDMTIRRPEGFHPVNRDLPRLLVRVAGQCDIPVLIHVSTANTIASGTPGAPADENTPFGPPFDRSPYALSKKAGEDLLLDYAREHPGKRIVILNPGFMLGPYDAKPSSGELMLAAYRKPLMLCPRGGKSFLHVRDAATAIVNALERGEGRYLLTGEYFSFKDFYRLQARVLGYRQRCLEVPTALLYPLGLLGNLLQAAGIRVQFFWDNLRQLTFSEWYDCSRASEELKYPRTEVSEGIADFFRWWNQKV